MRLLVVTPVVLGILPGCFVCPNYDGTETLGLHGSDIAEQLQDGVVDDAECQFLCGAMLNASEVDECRLQYIGDLANGEPVGEASSDSGSYDYELTCAGTFQPVCKGRRPEGLRRVGTAGVTGLGAWAADACTMEAASVIAFRRLARDLRRLGAPDDLVEDARRSASDEVRHARAMRRLARVHGVEPRRPRVRAVKPPDLRRLARQNLVVGCLEETWAALVACHQAQHAADDEVRREMAGIARDELRHAELAWAIHRWAGRDLGATWSRAVARQRAAVTAPVDAGLARDLGVPTGREALRLFDGLVAGLPG